MNWTGPCILLLFLGAILAFALWRRNGLFGAMCWVLGGLGVAALSCGLVLLGQKLVDWPAQPLVNTDAMNGADAWMLGVLLTVYGVVLLTLGIVLRQLLRSL